MISSPYTPQRVAIDERGHRLILEIAKTLLPETFLPPELWSFVCHYDFYLINKLPNPILNNDSPYQKIFGGCPNYTTLRDFDILCYPWLKPYTKNKLDPRSTSCVYLGICQTHHTHIYFDPVQSKFFVSRDVQFFEK